MPISSIVDDFESFFGESEKNIPDSPSFGKSSSSEGVWEKVLETHGEGRGAFGGRDNALTRLLGLLRARRIPYVAAREWAHNWNENHCVPPLTRSEVDDKVSRGWVAWAEGDEPDAVPEDYGKPLKKEARVLLTSNDLLDMDSDDASLWLIKNVLVKGGIHYISAPPAGGKSWVMLDLARAMTCGVPWIGSLEAPQLPVLYIDERRSIP